MAPKGCGPVCGPQVATLQQPIFPITLNEISSLPKGFPTYVDSASAWDGGHFTSDAEYVLCLTKEHVQEIEIALQNFKSESVTFVESIIGDGRQASRLHKIIHEQNLAWTVISSADRIFCSPHSKKT